ncbi:hypothetical protein BJX64DRAFT_254706 [Aspergillus heterothallicus]
MALPRFLLASVFISAALAARCYYTDGSYALAEQQPCFPDQEHSPCCGLAKQSGDANDFCLTSGLCLGQVSGYTGLFLLNSCTDASWDSDDCLSICPRSMRVSYGIHILPCLEKGSSHWCCSSSGSDCCDDAFEFDIGTLMYSEGNWTNPTSIVNPPTATAIGGAVSSISETDDPEPMTNTTISSETSGSTPSTIFDSDVESATASCNDQTCQSNQTAVVGVGAGLGAGLLVCVLSSAGALLFQRRTYKRQLEATRSSFIASGYLPAPKAHAEIYTHPARPPVAELPLNKPPTVYEM